jgi:Concanavalin A-like lectin/glucanases superfamily/Immunoglobulin I-set domain
MKLKALLSLLFACVLLNARGDITNNLSLHLKLDETSGLAAADASGNGNNGTLVNFPADDSEWTTNGRINGALICNTTTPTNEYVSVANTANLNFDTSLTFTIAAWVNLSTTTQVSGGGIIAKGTGGGGEQYDLDINAGKFRIVLRNTNSSAPNSITLSSALTPAANTWYHVAVVYNASGTNRITQMYINGQVNATLAPASVLISLKPNTHAITIGAREASTTSGYTLPFKGRIDDVHIFNRALSTNDVYELYASNGKAPIITTQPRNVACYVGDLPAFSVGVDQANSILPLGYQWLFNGSPIPGATAATLVVTNAQLANAGNYSVQVSNVIGITISTNAPLQVSPLPTADIVNNLVGRWKFDDGTGSATAADSTANANTGTLISVADIWTNGLIGGALAFNADASTIDMVAIPAMSTPAPAVLDFAANPTFTLAAWANGSLASNNSAAIIAKGTGNGGEQYTMDITGGKYRFYVRNASGAAVNILSTITPNNTWQHLVAVLNATNGIMNLYVNGQLAGVAVAPFSLLTNAHEVSIGNRQSGTANYNQPFTGMIDDVRIYNRDLTSADIQALYLTGGVFPPAFVTQPQGVSLYAGDNFRLSGVASGTAPLAYQWLKNGANVIGATNSVLTFAPSQLTDAGLYTLVASNAYGTATSSVANVQLQPFYLTNALAGYWKFDDGSGSFAAVDSSTNGNNATLNYFPDFTSEWVPGRANGAIQFNSGSTAQYLSVPDAPSLNFDTNLTFTLAAWVKGPSAQANGAGIIAKGYGGVNEQYALDVHTDQLTTPAYRFYFRNATGASTALTTPVPPNGLWQHVVATYDGRFTTMCVYVNGQLVASNTAAPATLLVDNGHEVSIGNRESSTVSGYNLPFNGTIDDVRIYNRTLSAGDVQTLYSSYGGLAPVFYTQPQSASKYVGENLILTTFVDGDAPLTYQWQKDGVNIPGANGPSLTVTNLQLTSAGTYTLAVTNAAGFAISSNAVVQVTNFSLSNTRAYWKFDETTGLTAADFSGNGNTGNLINFLGDDSQWLAGRVNGGLNFNAVYLNYVSIPDAASLNFTNSQALSLTAWVKGPAAQINNAGIIAKGYGGSEQYALDINGGSYRFYVRGANGTSVNAQSAVGPNGRWQLLVATFDASTGLLNLYVNGQLAASSVGPNSLLYNTHEVSIGAREQGAATGYNWLFNGEIDDVRLYAHALQPSEVQSLYSAAPTLAPVFYTQPQDTNVFSGQTVAFSPVVDGTDPLAYQWMKNGVNIPGATNATLVLTSVHLSDAGNYSLHVTNSAGNATSSAAVLQVQSFALSAVSHLSDGNVQFSGTGPANTGYSILATTNIALPLSQWTVLTSGNFDGAGQFTFTDLNATNNPTQFYRISMP